MGCFNVACSISNLSISHREDVVFIPLTPPVNKHLGFENRIITDLPGSNASMLIYTNCFYDPFCLPIFGEYNDYGSLENIKEDANTKAIEKFTGLEVEDFLNIVTESRGVNDYFSNLFKHFALEKKSLSNTKIEFGAIFLEKIGFEALATKNWYDYKYKNIDCLLHVERTDENCVYSFVSSTGKTFSNNAATYSGKGQFLNDFFKFTGYHPNVANNKQQIVNILNSMAGMFINKKVYTAMIQVDPIRIFNTNRYFKNLTKNFKTAQEKIKKIKDKEANNEYCFISTYDLRNELFDGYFRDCFFFMDIYEDAILNGSIEQHISDFLKFKVIMMSSNHFFFPAMNGEQHGNIEASKVVSDITSKIIYKKVHTCSECEEFAQTGTEVKNEHMIGKDKYIYTSYICDKCIKFDYGH